MHRSCWCNHENILKHQILRGWNETIFLLKCIITHIVIIIIYLYLYGCFLKWWYPPNTPKWSFLVRKPMVVWYHHFRNPPYYLLLWVASFKPGPHRSGMVSSWRHVEHQDLPLQRRRIADWRFEVCVLKKIPVFFFALMFFVSHFSIGDSGSWMILGQCSFGFLHPPGLLFGRWGLWHSLRMATGLWADAGQNLLKFYGYVQRRWVSTFHVIPGDGEGNAKVWPTSSGLHGAFVATSVDLKGLRELGEWKIQIRLQMCDVVSLGWELWTHSCGRWCFFFSVVPYSSCFSCWFVLFCFVYFFIWFYHFGLFCWIDFGVFLDSGGGIAALSADAGFLLMSGGRNRGNSCKQVQTGEVLYLSFFFNKSLGGKIWTVHIKI